MKHVPSRLPSQKVIGAIEKDGFGERAGRMCAGFVAGKEGLGEGLGMTRRSA
jgi:hypothetical protein